MNFWTILIHLILFSTQCTCENGILDARVGNSISNLTDVVLDSLQSSNLATEVAFGTLNNRSFAVFNQSKMDAIHQPLVCIDPNAMMFGGFGNLMLSLIAAHVFAIVLNRIPVMNHLLLLAMFDHPDKRQTWDVIPSTSWPELKKTVQGLHGGCHAVSGLHFQDASRHYGTNGCMHPYVAHRDSEAILTQLMPLQYPVDKITKVDQWTGTFTQWMLSRPTPGWDAIVDRYRLSTLAPCGAGTHKADVAIQLRTWRDVQDTTNFWVSEEGQCHEKCTIKFVENFIQRTGSNKKNNNVCVFVTTDNKNNSAQLAKAISSIPLPPSAAPEMKITPVFGPGPISSKFESWHSADIVDKGRWADKGFKGVDELEPHHELKDWMLMSEATTALYTQGSTFAITARLRAGLQSQLYDEVVNVEGKPRECKCHRVMPNY